MSDASAIRDNIREDIMEIERDYSHGLLTETEYKARLSAAKSRLKDAGGSNEETGEEWVLHDDIIETPEEQEYREDLHDNDEFENT